MARIPSPHRFVIKHSAPHATTTGAAPTQRFVGRCACCDALTPANSVFLKNEMGDPSQLCISAAMGLVMPTCLRGMGGIGAEVWRLASVVDQFWIRSAIHSHGSTPDRKSRAVPSS
jgi:hypothetical protein